MRRVVGFVCMFVGALILMVGVLAKPVLYSNLAKVSLDQKTTTVSVGENMSVLKASKESIEVLSDVPVKSTREVKGIPGRAKGNSVFWQTGVTSVAVGVADLNYTQEGVSFNRVSGQATNCCGDFKSAGTVDDPNVIVPTTHRGLFFKVPFITQKTIGLIHWHALLLWAKRLPFHRKAAHPELQREVFNTHTSIAGKTP